MKLQASKAHYSLQLCGTSCKNKLELVSMDLWSDLSRLKFNSGVIECCCDSSFSEELLKKC